MGSVNWDLVPKPRSVCVFLAPRSQRATARSPELQVGDGAAISDELEKHQLLTKPKRKHIDAVQLNAPRGGGDEPGVDWQCCGETAALDVADGAQHV